ncbi:hypothetical protein Q9966_015799 [Columba livia]|nr:hypothetical protein Q9966_015799 [Columba livia]
MLHSLHHLRGSALDSLQQSVHLTSTRALSPPPRPCWEPQGRSGPFPAAAPRSSRSAVISSVTPSPRCRGPGAGPAAAHIRPAGVSVGCGPGGSAERRERRRPSPAPSFPPRRRPPRPSDRARLAADRRQPAERAGRGEEEEAEEEERLGMSWRQAQPQRRERRCRRQAGGGGEAPRPLRRRPARRGGERRGPGRDHTQYSQLEEKGRLSRLSELQGYHYVVLEEFKLGKTSL